MKLEIIDINLKNIDEYKPTCFLNEKTEAYRLKREWLEKQIKDGLKIKILFDSEKKKIHGMIEYTLGEKAWRAVDASGYLFINCIWINPNKLKGQGHASSLIKECQKEAKSKLGVAVITSDGPFMSTKEVFLKNKFKVVEEDAKNQLLVWLNKKAAEPKLRNYKKQLAKYKGWHIVYSKQCPWVARFIDELDPKIVKKLGIKIKELKTAKEAQNSPSIYSTFNLIHDGKVLTDRYISATRFKNIIKKGK